MLNLLAVSLHNNFVISHLWHTAIDDGLRVSLVLIILVLLSYLLIPFVASSKHLQKISFILTIGLATMLCISFSWNVLNDDNLNPNKVTIYDVNNSAHSNQYSHHTLTKVNYIIHHNQRQLQTENFALKHIKNYPKQYNLLSRHIHHQEHFNQINGKFMTKRYLRKPAWYNYL